MAKRGYKLQEFEAHEGSVNCLNFGKKNCSLFITGGDDKKVNLWSVGKPASMTSLCGHTSPVESAAFDSEEVLVAAGSSSGTLKLWNLEETKLVRTLAGHSSYCTAVEFHPFGEFLASGSTDTNLKIWDIRKKKCIHAYKGHTRGISKIRFTPDGRWVVSGGFDNAVKIWDLTAGKLLHEIKSHEGHIRALEFHPLEFLLATGSTDKTVKFWDLETFEMIGSSNREGTGVCSIAFHPDGRNLFCALRNSLKVYSWEPVVCHDSVDMGWSTLGDLCVEGEKLLGGAYYENSVAIWVADIPLMELYDTRSATEQYSHSEQKRDNEGSFSEKEESRIKEKSNIRPKTPDSDSNEIKTIYVDRVKSLSSKATFDSKEMNAMGIKKRSPVARPAKANRSTVHNRSLVIPSIVPRDGLDGKDSVGSRREPVGSAKVSRPVSAKPPSHRRMLSSSQFNMRRMSVSIESDPYANVRDHKKDSKVHERASSDENAKESSDGEQSSTDIAAENSDKISSLSALSAKPSRAKRLSVSNFRDRISANRSRTKAAAEKFDQISSPERISASFKSVPRDNPVIPLCHNKDLDLHKRIALDGNAKESSEEKRSNTGDPSLKSCGGATSTKLINGAAIVHGRTRSLVEKFERREIFDVEKIHRPNSACIVEPRPLESRPSQEESSICINPAKEAIVAQNYDKTIITGEESTSNDDNSAIDILLQNHDVLLSTFRSRLTRFQVVRHFWGRNDINGAVNGLRKLPDHSVQADVVGVLIERLEVITLDIFGCLLPVLLGLLDSKVERHTSISLECLLKLVAVFGTIIRSTVSAPPLVGVDLHAEERLECCKHCFAHLQEMERTIPELVRRGGSVARAAQQLNLVLQQT